MACCRKRAAVHRAGQDFLLVTKLAPTSGDVMLTKYLCGEIPRFLTDARDDLEIGHIADDPPQGLGKISMQSAVRVIETRQRATCSRSIVKDVGQCGPIKRNREVMRFDQRLKTIICSGSESLLIVAPSIVFLAVSVFISDGRGWCKVLSK